MEIFSSEEFNPEFNLVPGQFTLERLFRSRSSAAQMRRRLTAV